MGNLIYKGRSYAGSVGSNPNLLINGDFQVNQRQFTNVSNNLNNIELVDRWLKAWGNCKVEKVDEGLKITNNGSGGSPIEQRIECKLNEMVGKTMTLSASVDGVVYSVSGILGTEVVKLTKSNFGMYFQADTTKNCIVVRIYPESYINLTVNWVKLELGSMATQFISRPYIEELALCEYYFTKGEKEIPILASKTTDQYTALFSFDEMRVVPTVKNIIAKYFNTSGVYVEASYAYLTPYRKTGFVDITASDMNSRCNGIVVTYELDAEIY